MQKAVHVSHFFTVGNDEMISRVIEFAVMNNESHPTHFYFCSTFNEILIKNNI